MQNNRRYDLSQRLIHFFRKFDWYDGSAPNIPEDWGGESITEDSTFSPMFLLRTAIRNGHLWATWALRRNIRTIYGPHPAICFTDMPTAAFLEASVTRQKQGEKISTFAFTFLKDQLFALGARPVIYGLSIPYTVLSGEDGGPRVMGTSLLPLHEQYRFVTYSPGGPYRVDWTHEREWRWPCVEGISEFDEMIESEGIADHVTDIPGLSLYENLDRIGIIVNTDEEAKMVLHDVLSLIDRKIIASDTFDYILASRNIGAVSSIRDIEEEERVIASAMINVVDYLRPQPDRDANIAEQVHRILVGVEHCADEPEEGEPGGCWLWLVDNFHEVTRALLNEGLIDINKDGKYLLFPYEFSDDRSLRQREAMTQEAARRLATEFGVTAGYFSVLLSGDYNQVPSYNDDHLDNHFHYNWWNYGL